MPPILATQQQHGLSLVQQHSKQHQCQERAILSPAAPKAGPHRRTMLAAWAAAAVFLSASRCLEGEEVLLCMHSPPSCIISLSAHHLLASHHAIAATCRRHSQRQPAGSAAVDRIAAAARTSSGGNQQRRMQPTPA